MRLDCDELSIREVNAALRAAPDGDAITVVSLRGRHNLAVGLANSPVITVEGNAGYFLGGLGGTPTGGPNVTVDGFVGWSVGENLMGGTIRVRGSASQSAGASAHGGLIIVEGDASLRAGISLKGGTIAIAGDTGPMSGFMAQAGTILVGGNAGHGLGDSLYEAVIYVAGNIASLGSDARVAELSDADVLVVKDLAQRAAFEHIELSKVKRVESARSLYHFSTLHPGNY
jgi:methylamine---glutamate N-methyltransferase subunit B